MTCESRLSIVSALCGQLLDPALETAVTSRVKMQTDVRLQSAMSTALVLCSRPIRVGANHDLHFSC